MRIINLKIFIFLLLTSTAFAQSDSIFRLKTDSFDILYSKNDKTIDSTSTNKPVCAEPPAVLSAENVEYLKDTILIIRTGSKLRKLNANNIKSVKFYGGTKFAEGLICGALAGLTAVLWLHSQSSDSSFKGLIGALAVGVIVAIPCAVIGGIIGLFIKDSHSYNFSGLTSDKKTVKLIRIFRQHRN